MAAGKQTAAEIAEACRVVPPGIRILADYLAIFGFLRKQGDRFELTADSWVFLDRSSPVYQLDCDRLKIRLRCVKGETETVLTAASLDEKAPWSKTLLEVDTRPERSYGDPRPLSIRE